MVTGAQSTVAVLKPAHEIALQLIEKTGPLTAPSANRSGGPSPTRAIHILQDFGDRLAVLDGGNCKVGLESTVLDITETPFVILRKRSEEHTSELQSRGHLVCRLLLEKKTT